MGSLFSLFCDVSKRVFHMRGWGKMRRVGIKTIKEVEGRSLVDTYSIDRSK